MDKSCKILALEIASQLFSQPSNRSIISATALHPIKVYMDPAVTDMHPPHRPSTCLVAVDVSNHFGTSWAGISKGWHTFFIFSPRRGTRSVTASTTNQIDMFATFLFVFVDFVEVFVPSQGSCFSQSKHSDETLVQSRAKGD